MNKTDDKNQTFSATEDHRWEQWRARLKTRHRWLTLRNECTWGNRLFMLMQWQLTYGAYDNQADNQFEQNPNGSFQWCGKKLETHNLFFMPHVLVGMLEAQRDILKTCLELDLFTDWVENVVNCALLLVWWRGYALHLHFHLFGCWSWFPLWDFKVTCAWCIHG